MCNTKIASIYQYMFQYALLPHNILSYHSPQSEIQGAHEHWEKSVKYAKNKDNRSCQPLSQQQLNCNISKSGAREQVLYEPLYRDCLPVSCAT